MHEMDAATRDELRVLRARAYGPSADIDQEPSAIQRLRELESRTSTLASRPPDERGPTDNATDPDSAPGSGDGT
jgi:hypothetical protein